MRFSFKNYLSLAVAFLIVGLQPYVTDAPTVRNIKAYKVKAKKKSVGLQAADSTIATCPQARSCYCTEIVPDTIVGGVQVQAEEVILQGIEPDAAVSFSFSYLDQNGRWQEQEAPSGPSQLLKNDTIQSETIQLTPDSLHFFPDSLRVMITVNQRVILDETLSPCELP